MFAGAATVGEQSNLASRDGRSGHERSSVIASDPLESTLKNAGSWPAREPVRRWRQRGDPV